MPAGISRSYRTPSHPSPPPHSISVDEPFPRDALAEIRPSAPASGAHVPASRQFRSTTTPLHHREADMFHVKRPVACRAPNNAHEAMVNMTPSPPSTSGGRPEPRMIPHRSDTSLETTDKEALAPDAAYGTRAPDTLPTPRPTSRGPPEIDLTLRQIECSSRVLPPRGRGGSTRQPTLLALAVRPEDGAPKDRDRVRHKHELENVHDTSPVWCPVAGDLPRHRTKPTATIARKKMKPPTAGRRLILLYAHPALLQPASNRCKDTWLPRQSPRNKS